MLPTLFNYEGKQIRTITENGEPWFVAKDACEVLELEDVSKATGRLDDDEKGTNSIPTLGGNQEMLCVNESGLYSLILGSRKPEAKAFKRWVTHEVIPSIRKTGSYSLQPKDSYMIADPIERARAWIVETEEKQALQLQIKNDTPFANFGKSIANSSDSITIGEFAKVCNNKGIKIGRNRLFDWMRVNGYLIKQGRETNNPKQCYVEQKLFELKEAVIHTVTEDLIRTTTLLTGKGQLYFLDKLSQLF